jgi:hypothetical protein
MKGKLFFTILLLAPLCCVTETIDDEPDEGTSCDDTGCAELGWCQYTEECGCRPGSIVDCQLTDSCKNNGAWCCLGVHNLDGCPTCVTAPSGPYGTCL